MMQQKIYLSLMNNGVKWGIESRLGVCETQLSLLAVMKSGYFKITQVLKQKSSFW